jgi:hypothetical protein
MAETATVKKPLLVTPLLEDKPCDIATVDNKEVLKLLELAAVVERFVSWSKLVVSLAQ